MTSSTKRVRSLERSRPFLVIVLLALSFLFIAVGSGVLWIAFSPIPDISSFGTREVSQSTKIYDRTGTVLLYDYNRDTQREVVPLSSISPFIQKATIAIEDSSFYSHGGIRISSIIRAMFADMLGGSFAQGGSTITQQVVKNTMLTNEKSIIRKVHEWILAIRLEQYYSKNQILETYLNEMPYGGTLYGVESASKSFFGKSAKNVTIAEAAYLASLLQAPTYYSPYGNHRLALDERKNVVLRRMKELGFITNKQYISAKKEKVVFAHKNNSSIIAPHFVFYILNKLSQNYGTNSLQRGLHVITTLNVDLQNKLQNIVSTYGDKNAKNFNASNEAAVAVDPKTGQILAMIGSRDYFNEKIDGNYNDALALLQPGSTFKPFVYATALKKGFTRDTTIFDLPTQFSTNCAPSDTKNDVPPCYAPSNFDNAFRGPMTFTTALAQSINVPAVKVLYLTGIKPVIDLATASGITSITGDISRYGLSFALGAADVSLLDMTDAYGTFANNGIHNPPTGILRVTNTNGNVLTEYQNHSVRVMPSSVAHDISAMLSNNSARFPEYPPINPLNFPGYDVAVKTGTTNDYRDAWTIGYTPSIVIGVWAGNNDHSPMVKKIAGYIVAPMWHEMMQYALNTYPKSYFGEPTTISSSTKPVLRGQYRIKKDGIFTTHSLLYWVNKNNPQEPSPENPSKDPQFLYWEYPVSIWRSEHNINNATSTITPSTISNSQ
ncbi:Multimodular transpeptidase-transglycosylase [hydrothermal vent metagenome]|uniref:peptidoglycan glycosyltransferase n=1 Tax=hydrothermal vent metagenome TaxID=652676 RepID=A0A3B0UUL2_9ZZZZ